MPPLAITYTFFAFSAGFSLGPSIGELHDGGAAATGRHLPIVGAVAVAYGGLALLGFGRLVARRPRTALLLAACLLTAFAGARWMAAANVKVWNARYVAVAYPAYLVVVATGLSSLGSRARSIALAAVLALAALALWNLRADPRYAKEDYRSAGAYLAGALRRRCRQAWAPPLRSSSMRGTSRQATSSSTRTASATRPSSAAGSPPPPPAGRAPGSSAPAPTRAIRGTTSARSWVRRAGERSG
jgi:hypothetical protein